MSKLTRIISQLQKAKGKGALEIDLFDDMDKSANIRKIKSRANKFLGDTQAITVVDGRWYLSKEFWSITPIEIRDLLLAYEIRSLKRVVFLFMFFTLITTLLIGILVGIFFEVEVLYG